MNVFESFEQLEIKEPVTVLIGMFDGIHIGHQALFKEAKKLSSNKILVITFKNSPLEILSPQTTIDLLIPFSEKIKWLKAYGADYILALKFDEELVKWTATQFFSKIKEKIAFKNVIIGFNATIGSDQKDNST